MPKKLSKLSYTVAEACEVVGISKSFMYDLISDGRLQAVKLGDRTLVTEFALRKLLRSLPRAEVHMGPRHQSRRAKTTTSQL